MSQDKKEIHDLSEKEQALTDSLKTELHEWLENVDAAMPERKDNFSKEYKNL